MLSRRGVLGGLIGLVAAPVVARAASIVPVRSFKLYPWQREAMEFARQGGSYTGRWTWMSKEEAEHRFPQVIPRISHGQISEVSRHRTSDEVMRVLRQTVHPTVRQCGSSAEVQQRETQGREEVTERKRTMSARGWWEISTGYSGREGTRSLGVFYGFAHELAFALGTLQCGFYHEGSLYFERCETPDVVSTVSKKLKPVDKVNVVFDDFNYSPDDLVKAVRRMMRGLPVEVTENNFYGSVTLTRKKVK